NRSPASRLAAGDGATNYARLPAPLGPVGRREFEIKDADPFDKRIRTAPCAQRASVAQIRRTPTHAGNADEIRVSSESANPPVSAKRERMGRKGPPPAPRIPHFPPHRSPPVPDHGRAPR